MARTTKLSEQQKAILGELQRGRAATDDVYPEGYMMKTRALSRAVALALDDGGDRVKENPLGPVPPGARPQTWRRETLLTSSHSASFSRALSSLVDRGLVEREHSARRTMIGAFELVWSIRPEPPETSRSSERQRWVRLTEDGEQALDALGLSG